MKRADLDRLDRIFDGSTPDIAVANHNGRIWATDGVVLVDLTQYAPTLTELADGPYRYIKRSGFRPSPNNRFSGTHRSGISVAANTVLSVLEGRWSGIQLDRDEVPVTVSERGIYITRRTGWGVANEEVPARQTRFHGHDAVGYVNADRFDALIDRADAAHAAAERPAHCNIRFQAGLHTVGLLMPLRPADSVFAAEQSLSAA